MIQLVEVYNEVSSASRGTSKYNVREVYINPEHVVAIRPDSRMRMMLQEGLLPEDLETMQVQHINKQALRLLHLNIRMVQILLTCLRLKQELMVHQQIETIRLQYLMLNLQAKYQEVIMEHLH